MTLQMGPMRFPQFVKYEGSNETLEIQDHKLVFDLADEVNRRNGNATSARISFIPWLQSSPNGLQDFGGIRKPDGSVPTLAETRADPSLNPETPPNPEVDAVSAKVEETLSDPAFIAELSRNVFRAHKDFLDSGLGGLGGDSWSEFAYIHNYLKTSLNVTYQVLDDIGATGGGSFWDSLYDSNYFAATTWRTIDGGLSRLPSAFLPIISKSPTSTLQFNRKINGISYSNNRVELSWQPDPLSKKTESASYDYAIPTVPLALLRTWKLPAFRNSLRVAIDGYTYDTVCKVALQFEKRFWEQTSAPILGGCSTATDTYGIGRICCSCFVILRFLQHVTPIQD